MRTVPINEFNKRGIHMNVFENPKKIIAAKSIGIMIIAANCPEVAYAKNLNVVGGANIVVIANSF